MTCKVKQFKFFFLLFQFSWLELKAHESKKIQNIYIEFHLVVGRYRR